jgi:hypothetical protein
MAPSVDTTILKCRSLTDAPFDPATDIRRQAAPRTGPLVGHQTDRSLLLVRASPTAAPEMSVHQPA